MVTPAYNKPKAIRLNPVYAKRCGWLDRFQQIGVVLGYTNMSPGPEAFADGVARWQLAHPPLKADGILGPNTWAKMEPDTRFSPGMPADPPPWTKKLPPPKKPAMGEPPEVKLNTFAGTIFDLGGFLAVGGMNVAVGSMQSLDDSRLEVNVMAERYRAGIGLGGGVGCALCLAMGVERPGDINKISGSGVDFNFAIGVKWGAMAKTAVRAGKYAAVAKKLERLMEMKKAADTLAKAKKIATTAGKLSPDEYAQLVKLGREINAAKDNFGTGKPTMTCLTLPIPGQIEASLFYQWESWSTF